MKLMKPTTIKVDTELTAFRLPTKLLQAFDAECERAGVNRSEALRQLVELFLSQAKGE